MTKAIGLDKALATLKKLDQPNLDKASQRVVMAAARSLVGPMRRTAVTTGHGRNPGSLVRSISARRGKRTRNPGAIVGP